MKFCACVAKVGQCASLYWQDFKEVKWELHVWGGVFFSLFFHIGKLHLVFLEEQDDVKCQVTQECPNLYKDD